MNKVKNFFPLGLGLVFPLLLHRQQAGINILLLNLIIIITLYLLGRLNLKNFLFRLVSIGVLLSGVASTFHGSDLTVAVTSISLFMLAGLSVSPDIKILPNSVITGFIGTITAPSKYVELNSTSSSFRIRRSLFYIYLIVIPLFLVLIFILIYSEASPYYNQVTSGLIKFISDSFADLFKAVSPQAFAIGILGFIAGLLLYFGSMPNLFYLPFETGNNVLIRERRQYNGQVNGLKNEMKLAIVIMFLLNLVVGLMNYLDIYNIWFGFKWDGGLLKQFVHEGTWLLIFSIFVSIILVLWIFRGNLNFYKKRGVLVLLTKIWIAQNLLLAISVGIRNFWYMHYFNLAFKRIGVYAFLLLVIIGLVTVYLKVQHRKNLRYLIMVNSVAFYIVLLSVSLINWDKTISHFNINRSEKALFHTDFMLTMDESALPILIEGKEILELNEEKQNQYFPYRSSFLTLKAFNEKLDFRKKQFVSGYPQMHWLSWNYADYRAYKKLK